MDKAFSGKLKDKRVLITGGLGMIGSTIARKPLHQGASVTLVDACIEPFGANRFNAADALQQYPGRLTDQSL